MCMERGGTVATEEDWRNVNVYPEWVDVYHVNGRGVVKVVGVEAKPRNNIGSGGSCLFTTTGTDTRWRSFA